VGTAALGCPPSEARQDLYQGTASAVPQAEPISTALAAEVNGKQLRRLYMTRKPEVAVCVENECYPASLELRKVYRLLKDEQASKHGQVRVIDESGEDYLYPEEFFVPIKLPEAAERAMLKAV
jgi:hypothetical protein